MNVERCSVVGLIVMTMSRYGYIEEYKKLIDTLKIALTECWKIIINDSESSKMEKLAAVGRSNETIARLQSIYQYLPQIMMTDLSSAVHEEERIMTICNSYKKKNTTLTRSKNKVLDTD
jgi:hypothetical protein